jgi:hypothetical protein
MARPVWGEKLIPNDDFARPNFGTRPLLAGRVGLVVADWRSVRTGRIRRSER